MITRGSRQCLAWAVRLGIIGMLAGCGGGGAATVINSSTGRTERSAAPAITRAHAIAFGHAVNLEARDLPGMRITAPEREGKPASAGDQELARCAGLTGPARLIAKINSPTFTGATEDEFEWIKSAVEVQPTTTLAERSYAAVLGARGMECVRRLIPAALARGLAKSAGRGELRFGPVTVARLPTPLPGVQSFAIEIATTLTGTRVRGRELPVHIELLGFVYDQAEVGLIALGMPEEISEETEQRLLGVMYARAEARGL